MSIEGYNEKDLASVLDGAADLIGRASAAFTKIGTYGTPGVVQTALRKDVDVCLAEAEELIAQVRAAK